MTDCGADSDDLARRDRRSRSRAADENPALGGTRLDRLADLSSLVGVVDANRSVVRTEIDHIVAREHLEHTLPQRDAAMIKGNRDLHCLDSIDFPSIEG